MKRTFGIIAALILALCLCACTKSGESTTQPTETQPSSTQDLSVYEKSEGLLSQEVWYNENGLKFSTVKYEYDAAGRLVKETTLGINDAPVGYKEYVLNADGLPETMINYIADGPEEYSEEYRVLFEYNDTGLKMKETSMIGDTAASVTTYAYEGSDLVDEKYYEGSELISEIAYEYDKAGRLTKLVRRDMLEDSETSETCTYDKNGLLASREVSGSDGIESRTEYSYDEHENEISVSIYGPGGDTISITKNEYEYDEPGNIVKCTRTQGDGEQSTVIEYSWSYVKG